VQRVINVLQELKRKLQLLSFFTIETMEKVAPNEEELLIHFQDEKAIKQIKEHWELMKVFRKEHCLEEEQEKPQDKGENKNDDEQQEQVIEEKTEREKENLLDMKENESSQKLAKSTKNICREFFKNDAFFDKMKKLHTNQMISKFVDEFSILLDNNIKQVKMTLEEEKSDKTLNAYLTAKIIELENEIKVKKLKLEKLVKDRTNYKNDCKTQLEEINRDRENIKNFTENKLKEKEYEVNSFLTRREDDFEKNKEDLGKRLKDCEAEFSTKRTENEQKERSEMEQLANAEKALEGVINEFDQNLGDLKESIESKSKTNQELAMKNDNDRNLRDKLLEKYNTYLESYRQYDKKRNEEEFKQRQNILSSEFVQAHFRGFITRKQLKKKFKFLNVPHNN